MTPELVFRDPYLLDFLGLQDTSGWLPSISNWADLKPATKGRWSSTCDGWTRMSGGPNMKRRRLASSHAAASTRIRFLSHGRRVPAPWQAGAKNRRWLTFVADHAIGIELAISSLY